MSDDVKLTQPETRSTGSTRPGRRSTGSRVNGSVRSMVNRVNPTGQRPTGTTRPVNGSTVSTVNRVNPTGQRVNPVNGQQGQPDRSSGQPGQRSTGQPGQRSTGSTRSNSDPVNTAQPCPRAATRCPTRRLFWWRVRAREREFLGNFGTYRFVSKFPTIWYIDLACLKLLKI